jgi:hypothetical protein
MKQINIFEELNELGATITEDSVTAKNNTKFREESLKLLTRKATLKLGKHQMENL